MIVSEDLRAARTPQLAAAAAERAQNKRADVRRALMKLRARGGPFDLTTVAREAGCSTSYLRKQSGLFAEIRALAAASPAGAPRHGSANASSLASLRTKLQVATDRLRSLQQD